jgi:hypothetical protein
LLVICADDSGARRDIEAWLMSAGGALPIEEIAEKWRRHKHHEPFICDDETQNRNPGLKGYAIENGVVRLPGVGRRV